MTWPTTLEIGLMKNDGFMLGNVLKQGDGLATRCHWRM
jgi:hypothetical protein